MNILQRPRALSRQGEELFVEMPAFRLAPEQAQIVFVCPDILQELTGQTMSVGEARQFVAENLLLSLDQSRCPQNSPPIEVWVDRQADPMNMSLNGNQGSGRAVYYGSCFNLKGIGKTALATSTDPNHSNGHLDLVSALWEAICANTIHTNLKTGAAPVLAVVDTLQDIEVPWREGRFRGGFIVRVDENGELDRPTHLFYRNKPVSAEALRRLAANLGRQDAEKFIEQILHGCWSAGNISLGGHMIDFDTVFALRSRAPQWSYRPNWLSNFFGLEGEGQKKMLKAMLNHEINQDKLSYREACRLFDQARQNHLHLRFLDLLGLNSECDCADLPLPDNEYTLLVSEFERLALKFFPNFKATAPWDEENATLNVFDFSRLFRFYPILLDSGPVSREDAMNLVRNPQRQLMQAKVAGMPESIEKILRSRYAVTSESQLEELEQDARHFIAAYDRLLSVFRQKQPERWSDLIFRAYVVNEERTYMNCRPGNDTLVALVQNLQSGKLSPDEFSQRIQMLIKACDRRPVVDRENFCLSDIKLFLNGYTANCIQQNQSFRPCLTIFAGQKKSEFNHSDWKVLIEDRPAECSVRESEEKLQILGPQLPLQILLPNQPQPDFSFRFKGSEFKLTPISRS